MPDPDSAATNADLQLVQAAVRDVQADVRFLTEQFAALLERVDRVDQKVDDLREDMAGWKDEMVRGFQVIAEDLRHDLIGAHKDTMSSHEDRILKLEHHVGLRPI